ALVAADVVQLLALGAGVDQDVAAVVRGVDPDDRDLRRAVRHQRHDVAELGLLEQPDGAGRPAIGSWHGASLLLYVATSLPHPAWGDAPGVQQTIARGAERAHRRLVQRPQV